MHLQELNDAIAAALEAAGLDQRHCYAAVHPLPPDGSLALECSDAGVLAEISRRAGRAADGVVLHLLDGADPDLPDGLAVASSVAGLRREPTHAAEMVTQAICGDSLVPLKCDGDWYLVRLEDGYLGWIRAWHTVELSPKEQRDYIEGVRHRVAVNHAEVLEWAHEDATPVTDLVIGTHLKITACGTRGWRAAVLPDGREGFIKARSVEPVPRRRRPSRERLAATGLRFLGIPYLWGGNTPKGFDCSGLMQRIFRLNGVLLPRDSDLQARHGRFIAAGRPDDLQTGDLMFFGKSEQSVSHVAMVLPDGLFLHAYGQVRVGSLDPGHRLYEPRLARIWLHCRDPLVP
jgi:hypothetical protein